jgi:enoyl-[acyl-carrier-protein] reductase (NADH)
MIDAVGLRSALIERYKLHPLGAGKVTDISNAALYLTSDLSRWVTGQAITIDGGYSFVKT